MGDDYSITESMGTDCVTVTPKYQQVELGFHLYSFRFTKRIAWFFARRDIQKHRATGKTRLEQAQEWPK